MKTSSSCSLFFFFTLDNDYTLFMENEQINPTSTKQHFDFIIVGIND